MSLMKNQTQADEQVQRILDGNEHIVSHNGTSQYKSRTGNSACGLAALNFARVMLAKVDAGRNDILQEIIVKNTTAKEIIRICAGWSDNSHLDVEDICRIPLFEKSLKLQKLTYGRPSTEEFEILLQELQAIPTSCVAIITRPPEIIACLKLIVSDKSVFVIFDSHPRPKYPNGAGFIMNGSIDATAAHLSELLPVDSRLLSNSDLQWQAQLLANYSGHIFVSRGSDVSPAHLTQTVVESSLTILALRAEVADLKFQNSTLTSENKRLETEMEDIEDKHREERRKFIQSSRNQNYNSHRPSPEYTRTGNAVAGPSRNTHHHPHGRFPNSPRPQENAWIPVTGSSRSHGGRSLEQQNSDFLLAEQTQLQLMESDRLNAEAVQRQFDEENNRLRAQMQELASTAQRQFQCKVCFDDLPEDFVARLEPCGHSFCRTCIRELIASKLKEHRFPVLCPTCMAEGDKKHPSTITNILAQQVGITEEQHQTWVEMEMAAFSVLLHCRKCKRSALVDRQDLNDTKAVACPLPNCNYVWCTTCQQSITIGGPQHSCDGSSELDHLMKTRGWKYCPSCKTPIGKETGCNHMMCISPGCNTHFCYVCGKSIVRSALPREVNDATSAHYRVCKLFEDVLDRAVPP